MKRWKKIIVSFLAICMLLSLSAGSVMAGYKYTVTLYAGDKGTVNGKSSDVVSESECGLGNTLDFSKWNIQATDGKYYVKGIRVSGRDDQFPINFGFTVTGDADYVVAYGIKANMVAYTVTYRAAGPGGAELAPSQTFYGDVGDKPVVAYQYIEGYVPTAQALTKTLSANAADNVFDFTYEPGVAETIIPGGTTVVTETETTTVPAAGATATAGAGAAAPVATPAATPEAAAAAGANEAAGLGPAGAGETVTNPDEEVPQGLVDLDDEDTPKGNIDDTAEASSSPVPIIVGTVIGVLAVASLIALFVMTKKRKRS